MPSDADLYGKEYRDTEKYLQCMLEVRDRINLVSTIGEHHVTTGSKVFDAEFVFLQLRKVLELIAFASLTANREIYSAVHAKFATQWRAKNMLEELEKINPAFYPLPMGPPVNQNGIKNFPAIAEGYLTKEDFVVLYNLAGEILHARNPFTSKPATVAIGRTVKEWVTRIQTLLSLHVMQLVDGKTWLVSVPGEGQVHVIQAEPRVAPSI
jgi:hypothetical protein